MENNKLHKLDLIFLVGISIIGIIGGITDIYYWKDSASGGFPVFSCMSIYASYALWIVLLIYSFLKYKEKEEKPQYVRWFMYFILPFFHIIFVVVGFIVSGLTIKILGL